MKLATPYPASLLPGGLFALALILAWLAWRENTQAMTEWQSAQQALAQQQRALGNAEQERTAQAAALTTLAPWLGEAPAWAQQLAISQHRLRIPALAQKASPPVTAQAWQSSEIHLQLMLLHEAQLLALIDELRQQAGPRWQFHRCQLSSDSEAEPLASLPLILADCRVHYREPSAPPAPAGQPMPAALINPPAPLGRLFLTPAQRQQLEHQRLSNPFFQPAEQQLAPPLRIDGQLMPSQGQRQIWINGQAASPSTPLAVGEQLSPSTGARAGLLKDGKLQPGREGGR